jgi:hypothetical protein
VSKLGRRGVAGRRSRAHFAGSGGSGGSGGHTGALATPAISAIYAGTSGQLTVNWTLDSEADNYTLTCVPAAGATVTQSYTAAAAGAVFNDGTDAQVIITGLTDGTRYLVTLSSENAAGTATATSTPVAYSAQAPGAVTNLTATPGPAGSGYVDFSWTAPTSSGTYPIDHYDTETDFKSAIESTTTSQRVTGLAAGSSHQDECFAVSLLPSDATFSRTLNGPTASVNYTAPPAATSSTYFSDTFAAGNNAAPPTPPYYIIGPGSPIEFNSGGLQQNNYAGGGQYNVILRDPGVSDVDFQATLSTNGDANFYLYGRDDTGNVNPCVVVTFAPAGVTITGTGSTQGTSSPITISAGTAHICRLVLSGTTANAYFDGTLVSTATLGSSTAAGTAVGFLLNATQKCTSFSAQAAS